LFESILHNTHLPDEDKRLEAMEAMGLCGRAQDDPHLDALALIAQRSFRTADESSKGRVPLCDTVQVDELGVFRFCPRAFRFCQLVSFHPGVVNYSHYSPSGLVCSAYSG